MPIAVSILGLISQLQRSNGQYSCSVPRPCVATRQTLLHVATWLITPRAVEQHRLASDANHQIAQETDAQRHDGGGMCKRLLESNTRKVRSHNRASDGSGSV